MLAHAQSHIAFVTGVCCAASPLLTSLHTQVAKIQLDSMADATADLGVAVGAGVCVCVARGGGHVQTLEQGDQS